MTPQPNEEAETFGKEFRKKFSGRKVVVTGGAGFLGSWLCDALTESNAEVRCVDNLSTGKIENVKGLESQGRVMIENVESVQLSGPCDFIFHFASHASPEEYQTRPVETLTANSIGTVRMLEHADKSGAVLVYASSSEVYGDAQVVPTPVSYNGNVSTTGVRSCYDEGKRFGEAACLAFHRQEGTDVRIVRIFNSYGPRIRKDGLYARALPKFLDQALTGRPITIYGDGKQTRSFCFVTDTIRAVLTVASRAKLAGEVINVGNTHEITIAELASMIASKSGSKSKLAFMPPVADDPRRRCPDISKAKKLLSWEPKVGLEEGLGRMISTWKT